MPQKGDQQVNSFTGGLITEASPLNFPDGASIDEINMDMLRNGTRQRRLGLDYEEGYTLYGTGLTEETSKIIRQRVFVWPTPSGWNEVEIGVVQYGTRLWFINLFTDAPSSNLLNGGNFLDANAVSSVIDQKTPFDFTIVNNNLIVVSEGLDTPFLLSYDYPSDSISYETARIKIRDLYGVSDGLAADTRPASLSDAHKYNLRNQGWSSDIVSTCGTDALECTKANIGVYPSNSDTWSLGKIADVSSADIDKYDPETLKRNSFNIGRSARGSYIIDLYDRGQSRTSVSGITVANADRELGRISSVTSLGGRLFYSGIRSRVVNPDMSPKLSGTVLFSQIARTNGDLVKCYQEADPVSPNDSEVVDTDGGVIQITEAAEILEIRNIKGSIFVFATNGVWEIRGDDDGFRATSFQVNKISTVGVVGRESIVEANGTIFFWAADGIYTLAPNQLGTGYDTINITIDTIQTAYNTIPSLTKIGVKGFFDQAKNRVRWMFYNEDQTESIGIPDPNPEVISAGPTIQKATAGVGLFDLMRLSDTEVIISYHPSFSNGINYILYRIDPETLELTEVTSFLLPGSTSYDTSGIRLIRRNETQFFMLAATGAGALVRLIDISSDVFSVVASYTLTGIPAGYAFSEAIDLTTNRILVSLHRGSNPTILFVLEYTDPGFTQHTQYSYPVNTSTANRFVRTFIGEYYSTNQAEIRRIVVDISNVVTISNALSLAGILSTGGNQWIGEFSGSRLLAGNTNQMAAIGQGNPPSLIASINDIPGTTLGSFGTGALNKNVINHGSRDYFFERSRRPPAEELQYVPRMYQIGVSGSDVVVNGEPLVLFSDTANPLSNQINAVKVNETSGLTFICSLRTDSSTFDIATMRLVG